MGQKSDMNVCVQIKNVMLSGMLLAVIMTFYDDSKAAFLLRKKNDKRLSGVKFSYIQKRFGFCQEAN